MRTILKIIGTIERTKGNERYTKTLALVDTGDECWGYGSDFAPGDEVMVFFDHGEIKMAKKVVDKD